MSQSDIASIHRLVWTALAAALVAVGAFIQFPLGSVPFSMQPFFVFLAGYLLGPFHGAAAIVLYALAGIVGLPVFAGGASGVGVLMGPTGGYIAGFVAAAFFCGMAIHRRPHLAWVRGVAYGLVGVAVLYVLGVVQLELVLGIGWGKALMVGAAPFILLDLVKLGAALAAARYLRGHGLKPS
jgi:biotin transport system substrate-specific component